MKSITSKNIVFVTGAFVNNTCWDEWKAYFENRGYTTTAPPWPFKEGTTTALRNRPPQDVDLALLTLDELVDDYAAFVKGFAEKPIVIGLTSIKKTYMMSFKDWQYAFVNEMPLDQQRIAYEMFTIPESKTVARGGLTSAASVDYKKPYAPLLLTSGSINTIIPAHLNFRNFKKYAKTGSILDYKEFEGRNHFVLGQPGWETDAEYIINWLEQH